MSSAARVSVSEEALRDGMAKLGAPAFREGQESAVRGVLAGRDVLCLLPTGAGKSLCYSLPALVLPGTAVVVSPLRALMADQLASLERLGVSALALTSDTSQAVRAACYRQLQGTEPLTLKLLYLAPEMLAVNKSLMALLAGLAQRGLLSLVAVDEAHAIVDWGSTFRSSYRKLSCLRRELGPGVPLMALTASATLETRRKVSASLQLHDPLVVATSFNRPNIFLEVRYPDRWAPGETTRDADILRLLTPEGVSPSSPAPCAIVYCRKRDESERLAKLLDRPTLRTAAFHGQLSERERASVAERFRRGDLRCVVATVSFGMGIDKADVRLVVHAQPPMSITGWLQEAGRAGRDGLPARNVLYYSASDERAQMHLCGLPPSSIKDPSAARSAAKTAKVAFRLVANACREPRCRRRAMLAAFGEALPRGACQRQCDACAAPRHAETGAAALLLACTGDGGALLRFRAALAGGGGGEMDFGDTEFGLPEPEEGSEEEASEGSGSEQPGEATAEAQRVALLAGAGGGAERLGRTLDALAQAESKAAAAGGGGGGGGSGGGGGNRNGLGAALFAHRGGASASRGAAARVLDEAAREAARLKLTAACGGDAASGALSERTAFAACRSLRVRYDQLVSDAALAAQRALQPLAAGASGKQRPFVAPRSTAPQPPPKRVRLEEGELI